MTREREGAIRVLQLNSGGKLFGGVSAFLYNVYTHMDRGRIQFDFMTPTKTTFGMYRREIEEAGGRLLELRIRGGVISRKTKLKSALTAWLREHPYDIIHINSGNFFFNLFAVSAAKKVGVPVRIVHSHNAGREGKSPLKTFAINALKGTLERRATHLAACSKKAAEYMFRAETVRSGKVRIIFNGIVPERFTFNPKVREEVRSELGLGNAVAVGHAGRFLPQKNHRFLISVFWEVLKRDPSAVLLLLGDGPLKEEIQTLVREKGMDGQVLFLGQRRDIERIYQAMDVFVLPSFYEGLPVVGVEVQAAGLPLVTSSEVTEEVKILDAVDFLSLEDSPAKWAEVILERSRTPRADTADGIGKAGYDIRGIASSLADWYEALSGEGRARSQE